MNIIINKLNSNIKMLILSHISNGGAIEIANVLKVNSTLQSLNLGLNKIGNRGAIEIANEIKVNSTLQLFNLFFN